MAAPMKSCRVLSNKIFSRNFRNITRMRTWNWCIFNSQSAGINFQPKTSTVCRHFASKHGSNDNTSTRPRLNVGTIGHIDHGKTTLTAAITRVLEAEGKAKFLSYNEIDRAPEEKARGITINACHVGYSTTRRDYAHTDCPGHIDYIKNMIVGTSQMDGAVLVVAATDGVMPQTVEHVMLAKQIGVKHIIVYINKADIVDNDVIELVQLEIQELLQDLGYDPEKVPIIIGSALCALENTNEELGKHSIVKLLGTLDTNIPEPSRVKDGPFIMPVEKAVTIPGRGTVLTGTVVQGAVNRSDPAIIQGFGKEFKTTVNSIGRFDSTVETASAGDNVGLLVRGIKKEAVKRGMIVSHTDAALSQIDSFRAQIYVRLKAEGGRAKPITQNYINSMYMDTWDLSACVVLPENQKLLMPGETLETDIILRTPMTVREGEKFFIRDGTSTTISGVVLKLLPNSNKVISGFNQDGRIQKAPEIESNAQVVRKKKFEQLQRQSQRGGRNNPQKKAS